MARTMLIISVGALLAACPEFPRDALHYEGGGEGPCRDRDSDRYTSCGGDCDDDAHDVHPDQIDYFTSPQHGSFDYNCDRREEKELVDVVTCELVGEVCVGEGWDDTQPVPDCGEEGSYIECQLVAGKKCNRRPAEARPQACR